MNRQQKKRSFRQRLRADTKEARNMKIWLAVIIVIVGLSSAAMVNAAFAGGWEMTSSLSEVSIENETFTSMKGDHSFSVDIDGTFEDAVDAQGSYQDICEDNYDTPEITVKSSYPFYARRYGGDWIDVTAEDVEPYDTYTIPADIADVTEYQRYLHWTIGVDVTLQINAQKHLKPLGSYWDYGWFFEDALADIDVDLNFAITPWIPSGTNGEWQIVGGWSGVMSSKIGGIDYGLVDEGAEENYGHTIQGLHSVGEALNMDGEIRLHFGNPGSLKGIPDNVDIELTAELAAGAKYTTDYLGHWDSVAVRNVYVTYRVIIDVMSTLQWKFILGDQPPLEPPVEDNTAYKPEITPFKEFFDFMTSPAGVMLMLGIIVVGGLVLYAYIKTVTWSPF